MSRFFVPEGAVREGCIFLVGKEAHHIIDVMRLKEREMVTAFDGTGTEYTGFIKEIKRSGVIIEKTRTRTSPSCWSAKMTLIQAIPKKEKMDFIVEKATELGVSCVVPVVTERTIPRWDDTKRRSNAERWRRIAREASKQCGRCDIPEIRDAVSFAEGIEHYGGHDLALIAALNDETTPLKDALSGFKGSGIAAAIGPEGDFTYGEVAQAKARGFKTVSLGQRVLKSDTAGLAMLAILNYELSK